MHEITSYELTVLAFGAIAFGIYLLVKGGDWTVDAAVYIAREAGLSKLFIGATIVAFGTSVPELFTSVNANVQGFPGIALGNVVGSNIANMLLVVGASAAVFVITTRRREIVRDVAMMLLATAILLIGMLAGLFSAWAGAAMFALLVAYVFHRFCKDQIPLADVEEEIEEGRQRIGTKRKAVVFLVLGILALAAGAEMLVRGAVAAGDAIGVPEAIIGLTVVALGTSLPELSTCLAAAVKGHTSMIVGNVVGSNIFNILSILGLTALVKPLPVDPALMGFDLWFLLLTTLAFSAWLLRVGRIDRGLGFAMLAGYAVFNLMQYRGLILG